MKLVSMGTVGKIKVIIIPHATRYTAIYANTPELIKLYKAIHDNISMRTKQ